ncbi:M42 family metallopeptidase [Clostridium amazonitimonense]|uniref:M42 family metallopeptidase n=1 Tax=Clostridium amazonitimonense TaxID=1499689 RepID=UPI000509DF01|nr:M42 family peptidase [Clostridium amazonitimonense]
MDALLNRLINAFGVSGHEDEVKKVIEKEVKSMGFDCEEDKMGNLIVYLTETPGTKDKLMFCAHMDSMGVIANYIDDKGFVRVGALGDFEAANMINNFVTFENGTLGRICSAKKDAGIEDLFIDLGVKNREEALALIKEGNVAKFNGAVLEIGDNLVAPYMDNRIGCYILLKVLENLAENIKNHENYLENLNREYYFVFSTQNKLGGRGARAAAYHIEPDYSIVIDAEIAGDYPGGNSNISLEEGPSIKIIDRTLVVHHKAKEILEKSAQESDIKVQYSVGEEGTDGATIHKERSGVKTAVLSVPCRYIHTNEEMINIQDIKNSIKLILGLI